MRKSHRLDNKQGVMILMRKKILYYPTHETLNISYRKFPTWWIIMMYIDRIWFIPILHLNLSGLVLLFVGFHYLDDKVYPIHSNSKSNIHVRAIDLGTKIKTCD